MTSANPPYPYFNEITYNSQYFASSGSGLTQSQANALYLRKTTADTAAALESFTGGILTNDIQSTTTSAEIDIGSSQTDGALRLGAGGATRTGGISIGSATMTGQINILTANTNNNITTNLAAVNIGTANVSKLIRIGTNTSSGSVTLGNLQVATITGQSLVAFNSITNASANSVAFYPSQTSGVCNIGCGGTGVATRNASGDVNIANQASNQCAINIMNGNTTAGSVNIATGNGITQTTTVSIGSGSTTGTVTIGNTNNSVVIESGRQTDICHQVGMSNAVNILSGGGATTGGSVNIANGASQTTAVNIATVTSTGELTIGANTNTTDMKSGTVNIQNVANSGGTVNIKNGTDATGSVNIANGGSIGTPTVSVNIGSGTTNGTVTIGNTANTVQINGTLAMGTGKGITLAPNTSYVLPSAGQLGVSGTITGTNATTSANTMTTIRSVSLTAGVWIIIGNVGMGNSGSNAYLSISATSLRDNNSVATTTTTSGAYINITRVISQTTTITWNLIALTQIAGTLSDINFSATRIGLKKLSSIKYMADNLLDPPVVIVETLTINNYKYALSNLIPHTSVVYGIDCFNDTVFVKSITGLLEGAQYKEWTTDDWLDAFIKTKVEELNASA